LNYKLPDCDIESKSNIDRINSYRKFFADMRLNRLYFHILLLKFFSGENNQGDLISALQSNMDFIQEINIWINNLKEKGIFEEFKKICNEEINVINNIIQSYESRMKNNDQPE
jgi:hypothetical protein